MKIRALSLITVAAVALTSCVSIDFVQTGKSFKALKPDADVIVFHRSVPSEKYEEIGILRIDGGTLSKRIEVAKRVARQNGGNGLVPRGSGSDALKAVDSKIFEHESKLADARGSERTQVFMVIRILDPEAEKREKEAQGKGPGEAIDKDTSRYAAKDKDADRYYRDTPDSSPKKTEADYGSLKRASYRQLIENIDAMKGQRFAGSLIPVKFYKVPASLKRIAGDDKKLLMMSTAQRRQQLLLIIPADMARSFKGRIDARRKINLVYTPVDVHRFGGKPYPVLKYVDEIKE